MAQQGSDYHRGEMNIHEQVETYERVMAMTKWGSLTTAVLILFLTLWFCTSVGFLGALITAIVVSALGVFLLRGGSSEGH